MALRPPLRKNTVSMPNTEEVEYEREMEITITASSTDSHEVRWGTCCACGSTWLW